MLKRQLKCERRINSTVREKGQVTKRSPLIDAETLLGTLPPLASTNYVSPGLLTGSSQVSYLHNLIHCTLTNRVLELWVLLARLLPWRVADIYISMKGKVQ